MVWWLEVLAQFATSTGLAMVCILVFWTYGLAFGRLYMKLLACLLASVLLMVAAFPHGVDFATGLGASVGNRHSLSLFLADATGVIAAVLIASFFFNPERLIE